MHLLTRDLSNQTTMRIHRHRNRKPKIQIPQYKINEDIRAEEVRVIDDEAKPLGVLKTAEAIKIAAEKELDLVEVSPKADPPVCKILDWSHFKYQKEKEVKKQRAQSKEVEVKGIRLSPRIGEHDFEVRLKRALKFLERGDKVRVEIVMRGREKAHADVARDVLNKFTEKLRETYAIRVEQPISKQGGRLITILARE